MIIHKVESIGNVSNILHTLHATLDWMKKQPYKIKYKVTIIIEKDIRDNENH